jgi:hypothetical protein
LRLFRFNLCAFASLADVVRLLPEGRRGEFCLA